MTRLTIPDVLVQIICAACVLVVPVLGTYDRYCVPETRQRDGVCGNGLHNVIDVICGGQFNSWMSKRSHDDSDDKLIPNMPEKTRTELKHSLKETLLSKRGAFSFLVKRSSHLEQNIQCECCVHSCSVFELMEYCSGPSQFGLKKRNYLPALPPVKGKLLKGLSTTSNTQISNIDE